MDREYDIFETANGDQIWRCSVIGQDASIARLKELAGNSPNKFTLMHIGSHAVIATLDSVQATA